MKYLVVALILSVHNIASAESRLDSLMRDCESAGLVDIDIHDRPDEVQRQLDAARPQKEADCRPATEALITLERNLGKLDDAAKHAEGSLKQQITRVEETVARSLDGLQRVVGDLRRVPHESTEANAAELKAAGVKAAKLQTEIKGLGRNWDQQFKAIPGSPIDLLGELQKDSNLPTEVRASIGGYLGRVPAYFRGQGPAPRQKLEFLESQLRLVMRSVVLKDEAFSLPVRKDLDNILRESFAASAVESRANSIKDQIVEQFSYLTLVWAVHSKSAGACELARLTMIEQVQTLENATLTAPIEIRDKLGQVLQPLISQREPLIAWSCGDDSPISASLAQVVDDLGRNCMNAPEGIKRDINELALSATALLAQIPMILARDEVKASRRLAGHLWSRGYYLHAICARARR